MFNAKSLLSGFSNANLAALASLAPLPALIAVSSLTTIVIKPAQLAGG